MTRGYREGGYRTAMLRAAETLASRSGAKDVWAVAIGGFYVYAGESDRAFEWLEAGFETKDLDLPYIVWPDFGGVRNDPRYMDIVHRMNLRRSSE